MFIQNYELENMYEKLTLTQMAIYLYLRLRIQESGGSFKTSMSKLNLGVNSCNVTVTASIDWLVSNGYIVKKKNKGRERHIFELPEK